MKPETLRFMVVGRSTRETASGVIYEVRLQSKSGHRLVLRADSSAIFEGYVIGSFVDISVGKEQTTLPKAG